MKIVRFKGKDASDALNKVKAILGEEAIILETITRRHEDGTTSVELLAAVDDESQGAHHHSERPFNGSNAPSRTFMGGHKVGLPSFLGFIGLNGCGKTTSLLKLAICLNRRGREVVIVNADQKKLGAVEVLKRASSILECTFFNVKSPIELLKVVSAQKAKVNVLVDFPGVNLFTKQGIDDLRAFFLAVPGLRAVNVVQANLHPIDIKELYRRIDCLSPWATVVTKVDELTDTKRLHEVLADCQSSIVYLSKGENISCGLEEYYVPQKESEMQRGKIGPWDCNKELVRGLYS